MEERIDLPTKQIRSWVENTSPAWLLGTHMYDLLRWILKSEVTRVFATGRRKCLKDLAEIGSLDWVQAKLEFHNGASFTVDTSWLLPERFEAPVNQSIRLVGDAGLIEVDLQDRGIRACAADGMTTSNVNFIRWSADKQQRAFRQGYGVDSIVDFVDNVSFLLDGGKLNELAGKYPSGEDGLAATAIAAAAHTSIDQECVVEVTG
jgi:predicted dehydrogenase